MPAILPSRLSGKVPHGRQCFYTGKKTSFGKKRTWRGEAVKKGGFGLKPTGITRRTFKPNLQTVAAVVDGKPECIRVSTKAIRTGLVHQAAQAQVRVHPPAEGVRGRRDDALSRLAPLPLHI